MKIERASLRGISDISKSKDAIENCRKLPESDRSDPNKRKDIELISNTERTSLSVGLKAIEIHSLKGLAAILLLV